MNKLFLAFTFALALPASAQNIAPVNVAPATTPAITAPSVPTWLNERGITTLDQLLSTANVQAAPEQRARLQRALNERNAALQQANARLSQVLRDTLRVSDVQLQRGSEDARELRELDKIRRFQPMRYYEMKRRYDEKMKRRALESKPSQAPVPPQAPSQAPSQAPDASSPQAQAAPPAK